MVQYGLTIENEKLILEKAKEKKNGVYTLRGVVYRVKDKYVTHFATYGQIIERVCGFNCIIGFFEGYTANGIKVLKGVK